MVAASAGGSRGARSKPSDLFGVLAFLLFVAAAPGWVIYQAWAMRHAEVRAWSIAGPPCPVVEPSPTLFGQGGPRNFSYGGADFSRRFGHASCAAPQGGGLIPGEVFHVCQFTGPAALAVTTSAGTTYFKPGVGRPATVTLREGKATCVVGGWFRT